MLESFSGYHHCHVSFAHECLWKACIENHRDTPSINTYSHSAYISYNRGYTPRGIPWTSPAHACFLSFSFFSSSHQKTRSLVSSFLSFGVPPVFRQLNATIFRKKHNDKIIRYNNKVLLAFRILGNQDLSFGPKILGSEIKTVTGSTGEKNGETPPPWPTLQCEPYGQVVTLIDVGQVLVIHILWTRKSMNQKKHGQNEPTKKTAHLQTLLPRDLADAPRRGNSITNRLINDIRYCTTHHKLNMVIVIHGEISYVKLLNVQQFFLKHGKAKRLKIKPPPAPEN